MFQRLLLLLLLIARRFMSVESELLARRFLLLL